MCRTLNNYLHLHIVHNVIVRFSVNPLEWYRLGFSQEMLADRRCQSLWPVGRGEWNETQHNNVTGFCFTEIGTIRFAITAILFRSTILSTIQLSNRRRRIRVYAPTDRCICCQSFAFFTVVRTAKMEYR